MKAFLIALALASLFPSPVDSPTDVGAASASRPVAPAAQREATEPPAWLLALTGLAAIALMRRPRR